MTSYVGTLVSYFFSLLPATHPPAEGGGALRLNDNDDDLVTIFDPETCTRKGLHWVDDPEGGGPSHELYYEMHGSGPEHVLFVMGLNNTSASWQKQVETFGAHPGYTVLVFDNRGAGYSGSPKGPYTTSSMAQDTLSLLDFVGWTGKREVHVVGISMGGMVSLELASHSPERIASLTLCVTTSGHGFVRSLPPRSGVVTLARMLRVTAPTDRVNLAIDMLFPIPWLALLSEEDPTMTNREFKTKEMLYRYSITRKQTLLGNFSQTAAALTHHVSPARLREIERQVPKIFVLTGDEDNLVAVANSFFLKEVMQSAEFEQWEGTGHAIHSQHPKRFNALIERVWKEGRELAGPTVVNGKGDDEENAVLNGNAVHT